MKPAICCETCHTVQEVCEHLDKRIAAGEAAVAEVELLRAQRDALLAACKAARIFVSAGVYEEDRALARQLHDAIAKVPARVSVKKILADPELRADMLRRPCEFLKQLGRDDVKPG